MKVVGGSASVPLAQGIAQELKATYVEVAFEKHAGGFPDGERYVRLLGSVADEHVVLVQTTHPDPMVIEFLLLADAIRDAGNRWVFPEQIDDEGLEPHSARWYLLPGMTKASATLAIPSLEPMRGKTSLSGSNETPKRASYQSEIERRRLRFPK